MPDRRRSRSVTRLLGLDLTPGKLRGLQRISNANGTLTMVALDQNSSMISMIKDSLKRKGEAREPTYDEIVESERIVYRVNFGPAVSRVVVEFFEYDKGTKMVLTHEGLPDEIFCKNVSQGTSESFDKLRDDLRRILKIAVDHDDRVSAGIIHRSC